MNNKQLLRRSLAFISALSFTYATSFSEIIDLSDTSAEPPESSSQADSIIDTVSTDTKDDKTDDAVVTTAAETSAATTAETTAITTVTTVTTTEEETTVTTTTPPDIYTDINMKFNGNVSEAAAKAISKEIFGIDNGSFEENQKTFKISYHTIGTAPDVSSIVNGCKNKLQTDSGIYIWTKDTDTTRNIDQVYSVSVNSTNVTLDLCHKFDSTGDSILKYDNGKIENDRMSISGFVVCNNNCYIGRKVSVYLNAKNGWYFNDSNSENIKVDIDTNSDQDDSRKDVYFQYGLDNNGNFHLSKFKKEANNQSSEASLKTVSMSEADVRYEFIYDSNTEIEISGVKDKNFTEKWSDAKSKTFEIKPKEDAQNNKKGFEYDVTIRDDNTGLSYNFKRNCKDRELKINFEDKELALFLYKKGVHVTVRIRPSDIKCNVEWENAENVSALPTEITVDVSNSQAKIPNLLIENNETYYLSGIYFGDNRKETFSISSIISGNRIEEYNDVNYDSITSETKLIYTKINSSFSNVMLKSLGNRRNDNCLSVSGSSMNVKLLEVISGEDHIVSGDELIVGTEIYDSDMEEFPEDTFTGDAMDAEVSAKPETKKITYIVLYKTSENDSIGVLEFDDKLSMMIDQNIKYIEIVSVFRVEGSTNNLNPDRIFEMPLDPCDKLIYIDRQAPTFTSFKVNGIDNGSASKKWFNNAVKLELKVNDKDANSGNENYDKINKLSEKINEITYVSIGRNTNDTSEKYIFTKDDSGRFRLDESIAKDKLPYVISYNGSKRSDDGNDFIFNFTVTPKEKYVNIKEELYVEFKDLSGIKTSENFTLMIDTVKPEIMSINLENIISASGKVCHDYNRRDQKLTVTADDETGGSEIKEVKAEYVYNGKSVPFTQKSVRANMYDLSLSVGEEIKNTSGKIKVTVTDNAGNSSVKYYPLVSDSASATNVVFDYTKPSFKFTEPVSGLNKVGDKNWFSAFPKGLTVHTYDETKGNYLNAGLSKFILNINDTERSFSISSKNIDILKLNGGYDIVFSDNKDGTVTVSLADNKNSSAQPIELMTVNVPADSRYAVEAYVMDYSKNSSEKAKYEFYIDEQPPVITEKYEIENVNIRLFGTFSNHNETVKVKINEIGAASGLKKAVLEYCGQSYEAYDVQKEHGSNSYVLKFKLPDKNDLSKKYSGAMKVTAYDNVGNVSTVTLKNSEGSSNIVFEGNKPDINIDVQNAAYTSVNGEKWYSGDVSVNYSITDADSGIYTIEGSVLHSTGHNTVSPLNGENNKKQEDYSGAASAVSNTKFAMSTENGDTPLDGEFKFVVSASDNAGNRNDDNNLHEILVYKDITAPEITKFRFRNESEEGSDEDSVFKYINAIVPYYHFSNSDGRRIARVYAKDVNASSGIRVIELMLTDKDGNTSFAKQIGEMRSEGDQFYSEFEIPRNFKGTMSAKATDNVGNTPDEWKTPSGYVHETPDKHASENTPYEIILPETEYRDARGNKLYNHDIDVKVNIKDTVSGIREVHVVYPEGERSLTTNLENNDISSEWQTESKDINLPTQLSTVIHQTSNQNGNEITVYAQDYSGNTINSSEPAVFSIDKTKPQISVAFDNNTDDSGFKGYYKSARTATIRIRERNFSADKVKISHAVAGEWVLVSGPGTEGTDAAVYQNKVSFSTDGVYRLTVDCSDICGNTAENAYDSGEFTIDLTAPLVNVKFDNEESQNSNFYNAGRNALVEVNELNFEPSRVNITGTLNGSTEKFPVSGGKINGADIVWEHTSGNVWKTTVPMNEDGAYDFNVSVSDKAGNSSQPYHTEFNIDTVSPQITFSGINNEQAYNDEVKPVIEISDSNIDFDTVTVSMKGSKNKDKVQLEGTVERSGGKYIFTAEDIPHTIQNDDIYTITAQAKDYAGNVSSSQSKISVNRFGSTFGPDEQSELLDGCTVIETGDIVINEINTDKHPDDFAPTVRVIKNGSNTVLSEGEDYSVELSNDSVTGWSKYTYTLKAKNFADDGVYEIMIYSEDKASNKNYSESIMKFSVDKTKPSVNYLTIENGGVYKADSKQVIALLNDNMEIDPETIGVKINGKSLDASDFSFNAETKECSFVIPNSNSTQYVEISASDMAGNQLDISESRVGDLFISTSGTRILLHKTWFKVSAIAAAISALGTGIIIFLKKNYK